jgi:hypothetical protein
MVATVNYGQVLEGVGAYMAQLPADAGPTVLLSFYWDLGKRLGIGLHDQQTRQDARDAERFYGQVKRALDALAASGTLVKISKGQKGVRGFTEDKPNYYTPAQYERAVAAVQAERSAAEETRIRWEAVHEDLERFGLTPSSAKGSPVSLSLEMWERITPALSDLVRD